MCRFVWVSSAMLRPVASQSGLGLSSSAQPSSFLHQPEACQKASLSWMHCSVSWKLGCRHVQQTGPAGCFTPKSLRTHSARLSRSAFGGLTVWQPGVTSDALPVLPLHTGVPRQQGAHRLSVQPALPAAAVRGGGRPGHQQLRANATGDDLRKLRGEDIISKTQPLAVFCGTGRNPVHTRVLSGHPGATLRHVSQRCTPVAGTLTMLEPRASPRLQGTPCAVANRVTDNSALTDLSCPVSCVLHPAPCVCCLQLPYQTCAYEMSFFGINLKKLVTQNSKDLLFSEVGVGGGSNDGRYGRPRVCRRRRHRGMAAALTRIHQRRSCSPSSASRPGRERHSAV